MAASVKQRAASSLPGEKEWDSWASGYARRSSHQETGKMWSLADVFARSPEAKQHFIKLCVNGKGCDPDWLAKDLMRFPAWDSRRPGRKPFAVDGKQKRVLTHIRKQLRQVLKWDEFPFLFEPKAAESMFFKIRDFEAALGAAMDALPVDFHQRLTTTNAQALAAAGTIRGIRKATGIPHWESAQILFDAVLSAEGRTDLFNNPEKLKKLVKRYSRGTLK